MLYPRKTTLAAALAAILMGSSSLVLAQNTQTASEPGDYSTIVRPSDSGASYQMRASDVIGMNVQNYTGDTIGEVDDLIITGDDSVAQAVLSVGGFLGIGDKLVAVPYSELQLSADGEYVVYNATQEELEGQPEFNYLEGERYGRDISATRYTALTEAGERLRQQSEDLKEQAQEVAADAKAKAEEVTDDGIWDQIAGNWKQFKGQVKQQWGELTDDELDVIEGRRDELVGKVQEHYGIAKEEAEEQVDNWAKTL